MKSTIRDHLLSRHASRIPELNHARCQAIDHGLQPSPSQSAAVSHHPISNDTSPSYLRRTFSDFGLKVWSEVIWIPRFFWGCIGSAWILIVALDTSSKQPTPSTVAQAPSPSHSITAMVQEQLRLLREIDLADWTASQEAPKPSHPSPPSVVAPPSAAIPNPTRRPSLA